MDTIIPIGFKNKHDVLVNTDITGQWPRCNRVITHYLQVQNFGNHLDTGIVEYELDSLSQFVSSNPVPDSILGQRVFF